MKEIKAYVRPEQINDVIAALEDVGIHGMTIINVWALADWADPQKTAFMIEYAEKYCKVVKLELICPRDKAETVINAIRKSARTGRAGDGKIFVADIEDAVSIRSGARGAMAI